MRSMRSLGSLVVVGGTVALAYGCSAAGNAPIGTSDAVDGSTPAANYGNGGDGSGSDASTSGSPKKDAGTRDSGGGGAYDAGTTGKAAEGSPCDLSTALGDPESTEACGLCGTQNRACLSPDGGAAGAVWAAWSPCTGEVSGANACDPSKTYTATACGNCGTMPAVCDPTSCLFESGFDCSEPINACHPTDTKFVLGASCATAGQGRVYTCGATCSFGSPSACEAPPPNPNTVTISSTVGTTVNAVFNLAASSTTPKIVGSSCPTTLSSSTSFIDIAIVNPTTRTVTVSLWDGPSTSAGTNYDTLMAWYPSPVFPPSDMTACSSASDDCSGSTDCANSSSGSSGWSSLSGSDAASIPAGGTITLYVGMYSTSTSGNVKIYAKTEN